MQESGALLPAVFLLRGTEKVYSFVATNTGPYTLQVTSTNSGGYIDYFIKAASGGCSSTGWFCVGDVFSPTTKSLERLLQVLLIISCWIQRQLLPSLKLSRSIVLLLTLAWAYQLCLAVPITLPHLPEQEFGVRVHVFSQHPEKLFIVLLLQQPVHILYK